MEETKELQTTYKIFRYLIYLSTTGLLGWHSVRYSWPYKTVVYLSGRQPYME